MSSSLPSSRCHLDESQNGNRSSNTPGSNAVGSSRVSADLQWGAGSRASSGGNSGRRRCDRGLGRNRDGRNDSSSSKSSGLLRRHGNGLDHWDAGGESDWDIYGCLGGRRLKSSGVGVGGGYVICRSDGLGQNDGGTCGDGGIRRLVAGGSLIDLGGGIFRCERCGVDWNNRLNNINDQGSGGPGHGNGLPGDGGGFGNRAEGCGCCIDDYASWDGDGGEGCLNVDGCWNCSHDNGGGGIG
jgi:hypothetical protein